MRPRDEGGVADDGDASERHLRHFEIVDRLQDRLRDQSHDRAELGREQSLGRCAHLGDHRVADQRRGNRDRMQRAARVGEQALELRALLGRAVPDHVVAAMARAQVIVRTGDGIAETLLARRQAERHRIK